MSVLIFLYIGPIKKMIQWIKNMSNFRDFLSIGSKPMQAPHISEEGSDRQGKKNSLR